MPVYLRPNELYVKNPNGSGYLPQNVISETSTAEMLAAFDETIANTQESLNAITAEAQTAVDSIESQKNDMIASIASVAGQGTDTTLSQSGVAADAKAVGELKSAVSESEVLVYNTNPTGGYINGEKHPGTVRRTKTFIVPENAIVMKLTGTSDAYWDIYGFMNAQGTVLSYKREGSSAVTYSGLIIPIPDGAKTMYFCSSPENVTDAIVEAVLSNGGVAFDHLSDEILSPVRVRACYGIFNSNHQAAFSNQSVMLVYDVRGLDVVEISTKFAQYQDVYDLLDESGNVIAYSTSNSNYPSDEFVATVDVSAAATLIITAPKTYLSNVYVKAFNQLPKSNGNSYTQKNIVWYGTSIPAAGLDGGTHPESYPNQVGNILGAKVDNKAVGSSCVCCKNPDLISASNPYGFINNFEAVSRCLTNTVEEMQWAIDHFDDASVFNYAVPASLSDDDKAFILSCSYENRLLPYLTENTLPDLFVFDCGHNDGITESKEARYIPEITGIAGTGFYQNGSFSQSDYQQHKMYDVTDFKTCYITGKIAGYYDAYTLFDANDNVIGQYYNNSTNQLDLTNYPVDVSSASKMAVSSSRPLMLEVVVTGNLKKNLYCFRGAMDFLFETILNYSPKTRIVMIGEYEDELRPLISKYQKIVADDWNIPIFEQWNVYGWSQKPVTTAWWWIDSLWVHRSVTHTLTLLQCALCDGIHPHSDASGQTLEFMAKHIAEWLKGNVVAVW